MFIGTLQEDRQNYSKIFSVEPTYQDNELQGGLVYLAGWIVTENQLSYTPNNSANLGQSGTFGIYPAGLNRFSTGIDDSIDNTFNIGTDKWVLTAGNTFGVTIGGKLYAKNAYIDGEIHATSGEFSGKITANAGSTIAGWETTANVFGKIITGKPVTDASDFYDGEELSDYYFGAALSSTAGEYGSDSYNVFAIGALKSLTNGWT
jgi:hypothetical protein